MSNPGSDEKFAAAIEELQAQRSGLEAQLATIDNAIAALTALQSGGPIPAANIQTGLQAGGALSMAINSGSTIAIELDTFHGLTTGQSIKKYLGMRRKPATTQEIVEALAAGGQAGADGANFAVVVNNSLNRMSAADGDISKVRKGIWGLKSWYGSKASAE
ncbi:MAG TPA: hypothetical protein VK700_00230 [Steroidobacteraceae bacterium]|jgi:hypothetical protein|nr:hypothetical protein [Steroidobacteraceae bacterium]